jgi:DNA-binding XRE family transcriptional regulator
MKRYPLKHLDALIGPTRIAAAKKQAREKAKRLLVAEVRKQLGLTQTRVAKAMGVSQSALSQLESQDDMQLSTLRRLVEALGGELDVTMRFGDRSITLGTAKAHKRRSA